MWLLREKYRYIGHLKCVLVCAWLLREKYRYIGHLMCFGSYSIRNKYYLNKPLSIKYEPNLLKLLYKCSMVSPRVFSGVVVYDIEGYQFSLLTPSYSLHVKDHSLR